MAKVKDFDDDAYNDEEELVKELSKLKIYSGLNSQNTGSVRKCIEWKTE